MNFFFLGIKDLPWHHLMSEKETRLSTPPVWQTYWKTNRPHIKRPNFTELGIGTLLCNSKVCGRIDYHAMSSMITSRLCPAFGDSNPYFGWLKLHENGDHHP